MNLDIRIQWHQPEGTYVAVLLRDGQEWYLNGALVGVGTTRHQAVDDLVQQAKYLIAYGENFLTEKPLGLRDRVWLFRLFDAATTYEESHEVDRLYKALRDVGWDGGD